MAVLVKGAAPLIRKARRKRGEALEFDVEYRVKEFVVKLGARLETVLGMLYPNKAIAIKSGIWKKKKGAMLGLMGKVVEGFYGDLIKLVEDYEERAFRESWDINDGYYARLYGKKLLKLKEPKKEPHDRDFAISVFKREGIGHQSLVTSEGIELDMVVGEGTMQDKQLVQFLRSRFNAKLDPTNRITSLSTKHAKIIENTMVKHIEQGIPLGVTQKELYGRLSKDLGDSVKNLRGNINKITRTTHQRACNDAISYHASSNPFVEELVRVAGPFCCAVCCSLDGTVYPLGSFMDDHPHGYCTFATRVKSPEELGIDLSGEQSAFWHSQAFPYRTRMSKFWDLNEASKMRLFRSKAMFNLWKNEDFPLSSLIMKKKGSLQMMSFKEAAKNLKQLGGVSYPKVELELGATKNLIKMMDPLDRISKGVVFRKPPAMEMPTVTGQADGFTLTRKGINLSGLSKEARFEVERLLKLYGDDLSKMPWQDYNTLSRSLGMYVRKDKSGKIYYWMSRGDFGKYGK